MTATRLRLVLVAAFAAAVVAFLIVRQVRLTRLGAEAARQQATAEELDALKSENHRLLAARLPEAQLISLRADHATIARLRNEIDATQRSLDARTRPDVLRERASSRPYPSLLDRELTREQWRNAGRETPAAALETMLWAASGGDVEHIGETLSLTSEARAKADELLASLPAEVRGGYGSPENFVALLTAKQAPMGSALVLAEVPFPDGTVLVTNFKDFYGNSRVVALSLRTDGNGWHIDVPPSAVDRYAAAIHADPRSLHLDPIGVR